MTDAAATIIVSIIAGSFGMGVAYMGHRFNLKMNRVHADVKEVRDLQYKNKHRKVLVLILDDSEDDLIIMEHQFKKLGLQVPFEQFDNEDAFLARLDSSPNIHVVDHILGIMSGFDILRKIKDRNMNNFVIIFSGSDDEAVSVDYMNNDADRYINKNNPDSYKTLVRFINQGVKKIREL